MGLGISQQGLHVAMAVDDAGRRRQEGRLAGDFRFNARRLLLREPLEIRHAVLAGGIAERGELRDFRLGRGDDELADGPRFNPEVTAEFIEHVPAFDAEPRLQRSGLIIDPRVDHFGIARRGFRSDFRGGFDDHHFVAGPRQRPRNGEADGPCPDYKCLDCVRHRRSVSGPAFLRARFNGAGSGSVRQE